MSNKDSYYNLRPVKYGDALHHFKQGVTVYVFYPNPDKDDEFGFIYLWFDLDIIPLNNFPKPNAFPLGKWFLESKNIMDDRRERARLKMLPKCSECGVPMDEENKGIGDMCIECALARLRKIEKYVAGPGSW